MYGCLTTFYPERRRCLVTAVMGLFWVLLFAVSGQSSGHRHQDHSLRRPSRHVASARSTAAAAAFHLAHLPDVRIRSRRAAATRLDATLVPVEEKLEEKRARLPSWELLPLHGMFDDLERELTRQPFTDEAWTKSSEQLQNLAVSLAECVMPFDEHPYLPMQHAAALSLVGRLSELCREAGKEERDGVPTELFSCLKYSTKKNGVARAAADVADGFCPRYETSHGQLLVVRGVERCLAEFGLVWSTARLLEASAPADTKKDFVFHLRALLEHAPARDRHQSVLILCRGLFTAGHNDAASRVYDNVHGAALRSEGGGYSLTGAFEEVQRGTKDIPGGLRAARQAFPFLEILARWAWRCETPEPVKKKSTTKSFGKKKNAKGAKNGAKGKQKGPNLAEEEEEGKKTSVEPVLPSTPTTAVGTSGGVAELEGAGLQPPEGGAVEGARGRRDTGVAALLVALAAADPSGDAIRSMQRWACEALLPEEVAEAASNELVDKNEVARGLICTHGIFVAGQKSNRQRWMKACREVGEVLRLLVRAMDEEGLEGEDVTRLVNHAMFGTTFLRSMPHGVAARKGYEHLVAGGRVPGDTKGVAVSRVSGRVKNWREAAQALDSGIAAVLKVPEETVRSDAFRNALSVVLKTWQSPYALADYYVMQRKEREVFKVYLRFLRALLGVSDETVRDIRIKDASNREHMRHIPKSVRQLWEAEPSALRGTTDPEVIFRMGEDTRSCMGIRRSCSVQNRALLGYLLQGNVRLVGVQSASGRMEARAVLRLLLRSDSMAPALFMDSIYYSTNPDTCLEQQVVAEAQSVSEALGVPLYRAGDKIAPDRNLNNVSEEEDDHHWDAHGSGSGSGMAVSVAAEAMCELIEVDGLSAWIYSDGAVGDEHNPGLMYRDSYPGSPRKIVLAELEYAQIWNDFDDFDDFAL